jgi:protocatechuate 3,4-dioxygenase beta subunit
MKLGRRAFLAAGAVVAALGAAAIYLAKPLQGPLRRQLTAAEKHACALTVEAVEGPYHVSGMVELKDGDLNFTKLAGAPIEISGHVYDGLDAAKPLAGAVVEIWHADSDGSYHPNGNGPASNYKPEEIALRGFVLTDAEGRYRFTTIYPGEYSGRTRHIHFKIRGSGKPELTTQLIVPAKPGDTLTFDEDDIAEGLPNCQLLTLDETSSPAKATFDFRLENAFFSPVSFNTPFVYVVCF